jgi:type I phosphodiesterase/nucleotide pyrophosphatase
MRRAKQIALIALVVCTATAAQERTPSPRERALTMWAHSYFPGRSGQIMIVPREGSFAVSKRDPVVKFMHGSPWPHDTRIPLLFYGPRYVRAGVYVKAARQQDLMPTVAALLGLPIPATVTGRSLVEAVQPGTDVPRVAVIAVLDGMRLDYFDRYRSVMPTLDRVRRTGAWFSNTSIDYLPTITGVGHTTVSTGTDPRYHGATGNSLFDRVAGKPQDTFAGNSPRDLMVLNIADALNLYSGGRAVIVAQGSSVPAAVGLAGHGACLFGARPIFMASYSRLSGEWTSNDTCYRLPAYVKRRQARELWESVGGTWMGHPVADADLIRRTSIFARFETDALLSVIEAESVGADEVTDLVLVNLKTPDFVGHQYGPDSPETRETLAELDRQFTRLMEVLEKKTEGRYVVALTADHGMPEEPKGKAVRVYSDDVIKLVHDHFDPQGMLVQHYEPENSQMAIDTNRLAALNRTLADIARFLEQQPFVLAAFTEDEVRRRAAQH